MLIRYGSCAYLGISFSLMSPTSAQYFPCGVSWKRFSHSNPSSLSDSPCSCSASAYTSVAHQLVKVWPAANLTARRAPLRGPTPQLLKARISSSVSPLTTVGA